MNRLENLPETTEKALGSLVADDVLKYRILKSAAESGQTEKRKSYRPVFILLSVAAVMVLLLTLLNSNKFFMQNEPEIHHFAAGFAGKAQKLLPDDAVEENVCNVGLIPGGDAPEKSFGLLLEALGKAVITDAEAMTEWPQKLVIRLNNGVEYEWEAQKPYLSDGTSVWSCEGFFEAFENVEKE